MLKALAVAGLGLILWGMSAGCDGWAAGSAAAGIDKLIPAASMLDVGNGTMDQIRQQDRWQDGTGINCPGGGDRVVTLQKWAGEGQGDQLHLRDGSCRQ